MVDAVRSAVRSLRSSPGLAVAAVLTLALAIGTNAGMVGLVDRALLSPPPHITDPDRLVGLAFERGSGDERARMQSTSYVTYRALRQGGATSIDVWCVARATLDSAAHDSRTSLNERPP